MYSVLPRLFRDNTKTPSGVDCWEAVTAGPSGPVLAERSGETPLRGDGRSQSGETLGPAKKGGAPRRKGGAARFPYDMRTPLTGVASCSAWGSADSTKARRSCGSIRARTAGSGTTRAKTRVPSVIARHRPIGSRLPRGLPKAAGVLPFLACVRLLGCHPIPTAWPGVHPGFSGVFRPEASASGLLAYVPGVCRTRTRSPRREAI